MASSRPSLAGKVVLRSEDLGNQARAAEGPYRHAHLVRLDLQLGGELLELNGLVPNASAAA